MVEFCGHRVGAVSSSTIYTERLACILFVSVRIQSLSQALTNKARQIPRSSLYALIETELAMLRNPTLSCRKALIFGPRGRPLSIKACKTNVNAKNHDVNALVSISEVVEEESRSTGHTLREVCVAIKDNICTADMLTTCSSRILDNFTSPFNATVVQLLRDAGASIVGKANCDEFGMG